MDREKKERLEKEGSKPTVGQTRAGLDVQREGLERGKMDTEPTVQSGKRPFDAGKDRPSE